MAYTALYRNFRPLRFSDMVGQEHITKTLRNQIMSNRVGHAYLFSGGRGTGKTTSAKILSRVVNCLNPIDGEPCNECEICKEILNGSLTDIVEMDAASNNGVDDIRAIREEVNFLPTKAKYRVYIIDEVHMLSGGAFNALLKTLEEPPEHVKFILATTEPQKLPMTILSRCQRFDFKNIPDDDIVKRLKVICNESNIQIDEDAMYVIANLSEGHMRDAISILERCSQEDTLKITVDLVKELVGIPSLEYISKLVNAIIDNNVNVAIEIVENVIKEGKDIYNFLWEIIKYIKDVLVYKTTGKESIYSKEEVEYIKSLSNKVSSERLLNYIYELSSLEADLKWSSQKMIMFETGIIKVCRKEDSLDTNATSNVTSDNLATSSSSGGGISNILKRLETLENKVGFLAQNMAGKIANIQNGRNSQVERNTKSTNYTNNSNLDKPNQIWQKAISILKEQGKVRLVAALYRTKVVEKNDLIWEVQFLAGLNDISKQNLVIPENANALKLVLAQLCGKEIRLEFKDMLKNNVNENLKTDDKDNPLSSLGLDINVIE